MQIFFTEPIPSGLFGQDLSIPSYAIDLDDTSIPDGYGYFSELQPLQGSDNLVQYDVLAVGIRFHVSFLTLMGLEMHRAAFNN